MEELNNIPTTNLTSQSTAYYSILDENTYVIGHSVDGTNQDTMLGDYVRPQGGLASADHSAASCQTLDLPQESYGSVPATQAESIPVVF